MKTIHLWWLPERFGFECRYFIKIIWWLVSKAPLGVGTNPNPLTKTLISDFVKNFLLKSSTVSFNLLLVTEDLTYFSKTSADVWGEEVQVPSVKTRSAVLSQ